MKSFDKTMLVGIIGSIVGMFITSFTTEGPLFFFWIIPLAIFIIVWMIVSAMRAIPIKTDSNRRHDLIVTIGLFAIAIAVVVGGGYLYSWLVYN